MTSAGAVAKVRSEVVDRLAQFVSRHPRLFVLTGAGCSTDSGLPEYRDELGNWKRRPPVQFRDFVNLESARQRYWARSLVGWPRVADAAPNAAHRALVQLEAAGFVHQLVTQNVDGLHQKAGSCNVLDLHGRLDTVECLDCQRALARSEVQATLISLNPQFTALTATHGPDGDAVLENSDVSGFHVPHCTECGGMLKPAVVFFGESVPSARVGHAFARLAQAAAVLVIGSSLMVWSGYRFCRAAAERGIPVAAVNRGRTRADELLALKLSAACSAVLPQLVTRLN